MRSAVSDWLRRLPFAIVGIVLALAPSALASDTGRDTLSALKKALSGEDRAARRDAILDAGRSASHFSKEQSRSAILLLRRELDEGTDTEARRLCVRALARLRLPAAWIPIMLTALEDREPAIRKASRLEVFRGGQQFMTATRKLLREEKDPAFRASVFLLLGDRRRYDAVDLLHAALGDTSPLVVSAAAEALEAITKQALGYDAKAWGQWIKTFKRAPIKSTGPSVAPGAIEAKEPPPHVSRSLIPDYLGLPLRAKDIVFLVDISPSVGSGGMKRARSELLRAVNLLPSDVHISALFFSDEVKMWKPDMVRATPAHKAALAMFLRGIKPGKRTDVLSPLHAGIQILKKRVDAKLKSNQPFRFPVTLVIVSDGRNNMDKTPLSVIRDKLDRLDMTRTQLHALVVGKSNNKFMFELAQLGGGRYIRVGSGK